MSRVQRELLELREKGLATNQRDKYKDCKCSWKWPVASIQLFNSCASQIENISKIAIGLTHNDCPIYMKCLCSSECPVDDT